MLILFYCFRMAGFPTPEWKIPKKKPVTAQFPSGANKIPIPTSRTAYTRCDPVGEECEDLVMFDLYTLLDAERNAATVGIIMMCLNYSQDLERLKNLDKVVNFSGLTPHDKTITNYLQMVTSVTSLSVVKSVLECINSMPYEVIVDTHGGKGNILRASYFTLMMELGLIDRNVQFNQLNGQQLVADYYTNEGEFDSANFKKFISAHLQFADLISFLVKIPKHVTAWEPMGKLRIMVTQTAYTCKGRAAVDRTIQHGLAEVTTLSSISLFHGKDGKYRLPECLWYYSEKLIEVLMATLTPWFKVDREAMMTMLKRQLHVNNPVSEILKYCVDWQKTSTSFNDSRQPDYEAVPATMDSSINGRLRGMAKSKHDPRNIFQPKFMQHAIYIKRMVDIENKFCRYWNSVDYSATFIMSSCEYPTSLQHSDRVVAAMDHVIRNVGNVENNKTHFMEKMMEMADKIEDTYVNSEATLGAVSDFRKKYDEAPEQFSNKQITGVHHKMELETGKVLDIMNCVKEYVKAQATSIGRLTALTEAQGTSVKNLANQIKASNLLQKEQSRQMKQMVKTINSAGLVMMEYDDNTAQENGDALKTAENNTAITTVENTTLNTVENTALDIVEDTTADDTGIRTDVTAETMEMEKEYTTDFPPITVTHMNPPKVPLATRMSSTRRKGSETASKLDIKRQKNNEESQ